jgi:hypothetical protein
MSDRKQAIEDPGILLFSLGERTRKIIHGLRGPEPSGPGAA